MKKDVTFKEILSQMINICTRVVTLIFAISTIPYLISKEHSNNYTPKDVWYIILVGIISGIAFIIYYIPKEISKKMMIFIQIIYFVIINTTVLFIGAKLNWFDITNKASTLIMEGMIIIIYFIVYITCIIFDFRQASKMNDLLERRKKNLENK